MLFIDSSSSATWSKSKDLGSLALFSGLSANQTIFSDSVWRPSNLKPSYVNVMIHSILAVIMPPLGLLDYYSLNCSSIHSSHSPHCILKLFVRT